MRMTARFIVGDVLEVLPTLEAGSVDLVLTSPPFLALRSYLPADHPDKAKEGGSQSTPGAFIDWLVDVVEALDRVLAPYGSMVIELGDTYAGSGGAGGDYLNAGLREGQPSFDGSSSRGRYQDRDYDGGAADRWDFAKPGTKSRLAAGSGWPADKSLTLIPELFRMTLVYGTNPLTGRQTRRWRLRNLAPHFKPNPPVGSLGDKWRPGTSYWMVFCRTDEAGRRRFFDLDAVRTDSDYHRESLYANKATPPGQRPNTSQHTTNAAGAPPLDWMDDDDLEWRDAAGFVAPNVGYPGAHYAVFSPRAIARFVKCMAPEKVCRTCGEPSRRIVDARRLSPADNGTRVKNGAASNPRSGFSDDVPEVGWEYERTTLGWSDCGHGDYRPGLILDPFAGSGTTLAVAVGHGRDAIGIDLDARNLELARGRLGMFLEAAV